MDNKLAKEFSFSSLLQFAIPNVVMMLTLSLYVIADGMLTSRLIGTTALSSVNMVNHVFCFFMSISIMLATGSSAIISKNFGDENIRRAQEDFSFIILIELCLGILFSIIEVLFSEQIVRFLGASTEQFVFSNAYIKNLCLFAPALFL